MISQLFGLMLAVLGLLFAANAWYGALTYASTYTLRSETTYQPRSNVIIGGIYRRDRWESNPTTRAQFGSFRGGSRGTGK
ncbi:MAG: hypothetical protein HC919_02610 [Oscillatoriales cyanobacterium SM2_2_1]|nr:hypothetical protein [Oscillatoriales cyanobacterium SM2_2_1]